MKYLRHRQINVESGHTSAGARIHSGVKLSDPESKVSRDISSAISGSSVKGESVVLRSIGNCIHSEVPRPYSPASRKDSENLRKNMRSQCTGRSVTARVIHGGIIGSSQ